MIDGIMPKISPVSFAVGLHGRVRVCYGEDDAGLYRDAFFASLEKARRRRYQRNLSAKFKVYGKNSLRLRLAAGL